MHDAPATHSLSRRDEVFGCIPHGARAFFRRRVKSIDRIGSAFLRRILLRMKELGVSHTELARRMKVSRPYVTKVLRQDVNFSFRTAAKLANALKMDFFPELRPRPDKEG